MRSDRQAEVRARDELQGTDIGEVHFCTDKEVIISQWRGCSWTGKVAWVKVP